MPILLKNNALPRRTFLRGLGVGLSLPLLDAMRPAVLSAAERSAAETVPRRMLGVCNNLGLLPEKFFPTDSGANYTLSPYLKNLEKHRDDFSVFSGVWHPDVDGGHPADNCFLTAAPHPGSGGFRNTISLDQHIAEHVGHLTRFPSMTLGVNVQRGLRSLSWTGAGVLIPCEENPRTVYEQLFLQGSPDEVNAQVAKLSVGQSIMDAVAGQTKALQRKLGKKDRNRVDQYLTGVRELEQRLEAAKEWEHVPKPKPRGETPLNPEDPKAYMDKVRLMYDMARLAFETDSTRAVTLMLDSVNSPAIDVDGIQITDGYHNLSHHGKNEAKIKQLEAIDVWHMRLLDELFTKLKNVEEGSDSLLDRTMIVYGSNLGNANTHVTTNLPVLLAGGGFRHGSHLAFDTENNYPLPNLFVSMLQRFGIETDKFATSTGTFRGLQLA
ncbi:hypothetical protein Pla22_25840 [Rubripirellula amarantea]|uniref:DUF1552 domain-containing protein n=1 Tax=Rubripirellula amarantea TaxID=2527999 RepID=A0A5C5WWF9_9BACT|nr:DUF1552 domain-containing protein [Rubripirellula amarantea]TWT54930.1 hypothetical protein Pla22_25840 [Rubripirellula amarantea]